MPTVVLTLAKSWASALDFEDVLNEHSIPDKQIPSVPKALAIGSCKEQLSLLQLCPRQSMGGPIREQWIPFIHFLLCVDERNCRRATMSDRCDEYITRFVK
eukprot:4583107-Amphidinium_carterae.2